MSDVPSSGHHSLVNLTYNSRNRVSACSIVNWLGVGESKTVVALEHAIHETVLCFRFVALAAHEGAGAVVATSTSTLEVFTTNIID